MRSAMAVAGLILLFALPALATPISGDFGYSGATTGPSYCGNTVGCTLTTSDGAMLTVGIAQYSEFSPGLPNGEIISGVTNFSSADFSFTGTLTSGAFYTFIDEWSNGDMDLQWSGDITLDSLDGESGAGYGTIAGWIGDNPGAPGTDQVSLSLNVLNFTPGDPAPEPPTFALLALGGVFLASYVSRHR